MAAPASLEEVIQSVSPSSAGFSLDGGRAVMQFWVDDDDLEDAIRYFLGDCTKAGNGKLNRTLPIAHPQFPWLYASAIQDIRGYMNKSAVSTGFTQAEAETELEADTISEYALFPLYRLSVEFTPRPYPVLADDSIDLITEAWTLPDGNPASDTTYAEEWLRFCDFEYNPAPELVVAQQGAFLFRTSSGDPNNFTYPGRPRITIPAGTLIIHWYAVPYSYLHSSNSYLTAYLGHVNQGSFDGFPPGNLLYEGVRVTKRYPPVQPALTGEFGAGRFELEKLCDLDLIFKFTDRTATSPPTVSSTNANWITDGFNCYPWFGNRGSKYYYASAKASTFAAQFPTYSSFQMPLLFTDPDV